MIFRVPVGPSLLSHSLFFIAHLDFNFEQGGSEKELAQVSPNSPVHDVTMRQQLWQLFRHLLSPSVKSRRLGGSGGTEASGCPGKLVHSQEQIPGLCQLTTK